MHISLIAAIARHGVIGYEGRLPWRLPKDMRFFRETTTNHHILVGRRSYESIPRRFRPLPHRTNMVLSRRAEYRAPGAEVVESIENAIQIAQGRGEKELFIIGGGQVYAQSMHLADRLYLTEIDAEMPGDTYFPTLAPDDWQEIRRNRCHPDDEHSVAFDFVHWIRRC